MQCSVSKLKTQTLINKILPQIYPYLGTEYLYNWIPSYYMVWIFTTHFLWAKTFLFWMSVREHKQNRQTSLFSLSMSKGADIGDMHMLKVLFYFHNASHKPLWHKNLGLWWNCQHCFQVKGQEVQILSPLIFYLHSQYQSGRSFVHYGSQNHMFICTDWFQLSVQERKVLRLCFIQYRLGLNYSLTPKSKLSII